MILVILTETNRRRVSQEGTCAQGCHWVGLYKDILRRWCPCPFLPSAPHPVWAPSDVHCGKLREAPAHSGLRGGSGTFKSSAQGGRGAETEGLKAAVHATRGSCWCPCFIGITAVSGRGKAGAPAWVCKLPGALGGRCFWNLECLFGLSW